MKIHELKTNPGVFNDSWEGKKNFEFRYDDRDFQVDDIVILRETRHTAEAMKAGCPLEYTGRYITARISYRHPFSFDSGLRDGWCIFGIIQLWKGVE